VSNFCCEYAQEFFFTVGDWSSSHESTRHGGRKKYYALVQQQCVLTYAKWLKSLFCRCCCCCCCK
jgi:hypothetical protein